MEICKPRGATFWHFILLISYTLLDYPTKLGFPTPKIGFPTPAFPQGSRSRENVSRRWGSGGFELDGKVPDPRFSVGVGLESGELGLGGSNAAKCVEMLDNPTLQKTFKKLKKRTKN